MSEVAGALYGVETLIEGAVAFAKGIYDPTLPLKATIKPISDLELPRAFHTVSVVKGRAYIFGGITTNEDGSQTTADNAMHIVILPSSGVESTDYREVPPSENTPSPRVGHSAAVIDDCIYIYGGSASIGGRAIEEDGVVWVFDTISNSWTCLHPSQDSPKPTSRVFNAAIATEHPKTTFLPTDAGTAPQLPPDPAKYVPEPAAANTYGTLLVYGGSAGDDTDILSDVYAFDISSRTWSEFPSPPVPERATVNPTLAVMGNRIYTFSSGETHYLDLTKTTFNDKGGAGELGISPLGPWSAIPSGLDPEKPGPGNRVGATLLPVTTGQGRNYLLLVGGESSTGAGEQTPLTQHSDVWALQLKPEGMTAASFKDAARMAIKKPTDEGEWAEVKYYDTEGLLIQESQNFHGIGSRKGVAAARGTEIDGCSVLVWGGQSERGDILGDGIMITVDR